MEVVAKLRSVGGPERRLLLEALAVLSLVRAGLKLLSFPRLNRLLGWAARARPGAHPHGPDRIVWAVAAVADRGPGAATCLSRALAAQLLLQRYGHASELHIGVARPAAGSLEAHAWLVHDGVPIQGAPEPGKYTVLTIRRGFGA